jgi:hypothetical protein
MERCCGEVTPQRARRQVRAYSLGGEDAIVR